MSLRVSSRAAVERLDRAMRNPWAAAAFVVGVGAVVGVATLWGQGHLPDAWAHLANSGAVWLMPATLVGSVMPTDPRAAIAGAATLVVAVVAFYAAVPVLVSGASSASRAVAIWSVTAIVAGPVFGLAGRWVRGERSNRRIVAAVLIGGAFTAEGVMRLLGVASDDTGVAIGMIAVGLLVPVVLGRSPLERVVGVLGQPAVLLVTFVAYLAIDQAFLRA